MRMLMLTVIGLPGILAAAAERPCCAADSLPTEPVALGTESQFVFDQYIVDNHWAIKYKREAIERRFHQPRKYEHNPIIAGDGGFGSVVREHDSGKFRMWYQTWKPADPDSGAKSQYAVAYAESPDGMSWVRPNLGTFEWKGNKQNNIVWLGERGRRASGPYLLNLPEKDRRGFRYVFMYHGAGGIHVVGTHDGLHWDADSDVLISPIHSDTANTLVFDPRREQYVMYMRPKHIYRTFRGPVLDTGASRRVARLANANLWELWPGEPQTILIPDEIDGREQFHFFYGMPVHMYAGVYWGMLWPFKMNTDIHTELAVSRDGVHFDRMPGRQKLVARGKEGAWDDGMVFAMQPWVEVGDEWWIYYSGWDGPHQVKAGETMRQPGIGLVKVRKEGFLSMHGPAGGGVIATRKLLWPGGNLLINANAQGGEIRVRVTDGKRRVLPGFDYDDCIPFTADSTAHQIQWNDKSLVDHTGNVLRLEFFLKNADLYTFRAAATGAP